MLNKDLGVSFALLQSVHLCQLQELETVFDSQFVAEMLRAEGQNLVELEMICCLQNILNVEVNEQQC